MFTCILKVWLRSYSFLYPIMTACNRRHTHTHTHTHPTPEPKQHHPLCIRKKISLLKKRKVVVAVWGNELYSPWTILSSSDTQVAHFCTLSSAHYLRRRGRSTMLFIALCPFSSAACCPTSSSCPYCFIPPRRPPTGERRNQFYNTHTHSHTLPVPCKERGTLCIYCSSPLLLLGLKEMERRWLGNQYTGCWLLLLLHMVSTLLSLGTLCLLLSPPPHVHYHTGGVPLSALAFLHLTRPATATRVAHVSTLVIEKGRRREREGESEGGEIRGHRGGGTSGGPRGIKRSLKITGPSARHSSLHDPPRTRLGSSV